MQTKEGIKFRAMKMGIATGDMPDVEFIWSVQRSEGSRECFGRGLGCQERNCRWRVRCLALDFFAEQSLPSLAGWPKKEEAAGRSSKSDGKDNLAVTINRFGERVPVQAGTLELVSGGSVPEP